MRHDYENPGPSRDEVDRLGGATLLEFGTSWCGFCQAAQPLIATAMREFPAVRHIKAEDGSGRPLGRSFGVKRWPTLVFLRDGREVAKLVRPQSEEQIRHGLEQITGAGSPR